ncbi:DUF2190 family protein [Arthrobacter sp. NPDC090010]|uniref:DUF2190 family protein n=1 Tax=Arthrobacter sp. NPDC090010 TaxID=3363942 RepID=UPI00382B9B07
MGIQYLPKYRPGDTVTFVAGAAVTAGQPVELGATDRAVVPAAAASVKVVGIPGHDAAVGEHVTVELGKPVHILAASGAIARGTKVEAAGSGKVRTATTGTALGLAITTAADGALVEIIWF